MDELYYGGDGGCSCRRHGHGFRNAATAPGFTFSPEVLETFLRKVYGGFDTATAIEQGAWREVLRGLNEATAEGLSRSPEPPTHEEAFYGALRHSNEVFAAFKVHAMGRQMAAMLTGADGKLLPFREWKERVAPVASHHTGAWLRTEYDTAVLRAHQAADWRMFERDRDILPNLRWVRTTSPNPEGAHRKFWEAGLTLPVEHPFWTEHHPGDRWNCKCSLEQTDEPATPELLDGYEPQPQQRGLENNPGKDGHLFSDKHPYFPESCAKCAFYRPGFRARLHDVFLNRKKDCYNCQVINKALLADKLKIAKREYQELKRNADYKDVQFDKKTGGLMATHVGHVTHEAVKEEKFFGLTSTQLEKECQKQIFKMGHKAILCDESKMDEAKNRLSALDLSIDNIIMDIRSITGNRKHFGGSLTGKNKQLARYNNRTDIEEPADSLCLYFHDPLMFSEEKIKKSLNYYRHYRKNDGELLTKNIRHLYVVVRGDSKLRIYDI